MFSNILPNADSHSLNSYDKRWYNKVMTTVAPTKKKNTKTRRSTGDGVGDGHSVVLFNCTCHTFDSVIAQLMYALSCTYEGARRYAYVVHTNGKATVFTGTQESCDQVADILAEIGLKVRVT